MNEIPLDPLTVAESKLRTLVEQYSLRKDTQIVPANGLFFLVDPEKPDLAPQEMAVFPYHDEAEDILNLVKRVKNFKTRPFSTCIDPFSGGGHSGLPILKAGIADRLIGTDINPRAVNLARANAELNGLSERADFSVKNISEDMAKSAGNTLYIANPPFALGGPGVMLDAMRDGGENGLALFKAFIDQTLKAAGKGDVICAVTTSRISQNNNVEVQEYLNTLHKKYTHVSRELFKERKIWRGYNGKKEQDNPMDLDKMYLKANPDNTDEIKAWQNAAKWHKDQGYIRLGYYRFVIFK